MALNFIRHGTKINFVGRPIIGWAFSSTLVLIALASLFLQGLNLGLDFTGGTLVDVVYSQPANLGTLRGTLADGGFRDASAINFGSAKEVLIRVAPRKSMNSAQVGAKVLSLLQSKNPDVKLSRVEFVGPQVGKELTTKGGLALIYALVGILIYVALRFEFRLALGAIIATMHDVIITVGVFSLFQIEFNLTVLAAVLAVIGYSLNDTVVVYDRMRENFRKLRKISPTEVVNISVNQTLSRTIMTSFATLLVVIVLFFLGGSTIHGFSLALIVGIVVGTYSSIYVASAAALALGLTKADLALPEKEGANASTP